ncbi:MAG: ArnT family glycosyltransferase, partial [Chloroflexota bacterium]
MATWHLLRTLFGEPLAWTGAAFLALDPFHIAISKVVHVDALLSVLMLLSALCALRYWQLQSEETNPSNSPGHHHSYLLASGALAGLAFLTKSPAYFLVPFFGLTVLVTSIAQRWPPRQLPARTLLPAGVWLGAAAAVYTLLWPSMWVQPAHTLQTVFAGVLKHAGRAHPQPLYYLGERITTDPGPGFYLLTLLVKTTPLTLPLSIVGAASAASGVWARGRRALGLLLAYGVFFFVQMSLGAKKDPRYLLPVFTALDILAGVGLALLVKWWTHSKPIVGRILLPAALVAQAALVWPYHPYYITYASPLVGGPAGAQRLLVATPEGEGLDVVARYLNRQPGAERLRVGVQSPAYEAFRQVFVGEVLDTRDPDLDYLVFADVYLTRHVAEDQWGQQWQAVR